MMNRRLMLFLIVVSFTFRLEAKKIDGQIFTKEDTIDVTFKIPMKFLFQEPDYEKIQGKIKYFDKSGLKNKLLPDRAIGIQFKHESENIIMMSCYNNLGLGNIFSNNANIFLKLEIKGNLNLYSYYYTQRSPGMYNASTGMMAGGFSYSVERYILQKGDGDLKRLKGLYFRSDMMEYFEDCPKLVSKIENKEYRKFDMESIVLFYNSNCE